MRRCPDRSCFRLCSRLRRLLAEGPRRSITAGLDRWPKGGLLVRSRSSRQTTASILQSLSTTAQKSGSGWVLNGTKIFVPYAHIADFLIVAARIGSGADEIGLFLVEPNSSSVRIRRLNHLDMTRRVCAVEIDAVVVPARAALSGGAKLYRSFGRRCRCCNRGGFARGNCARARDGSRILEGARTIRQADRFVPGLAARGRRDRRRHGTRPFVAMVRRACSGRPIERCSACRGVTVKARMCEVYMRSADRAVLMHGGIGFTWDHDMHLWFKRARFNESYFGAPPFHRERVATLSGY